MKPSAFTRREALASLAGAGALIASGARAQERASAGSAALPNKPHFGFTKLQVGDLEKCAAFYKAACELTEATRVDTESAGRKLSEILFEPTAPGGATFVLIHYYDSPAPVSGELILGFTTPDIEAFVARASAAGGSVERAPYAIPEMKLRVAFVRDVEGHLIEVIQPEA